MGGQKRAVLIGAQTDNFGISGAPGRADHDHWNAYRAEDLICYTFHKDLAPELP